MGRTYNNEMDLPDNPNRVGDEDYGREWWLDDVYYDIDDVEESQDGGWPDDREDDGVVMEEAPQRKTPSVFVDTIANIAVSAFLAWMIMLILINW